MVSVFLSRAKKNVSNHEDRKITQGERRQKIILLKVFFHRIRVNLITIDFVRSRYLIVSLEISNYGSPKPHGVIVYFQ